MAGIYILINGHLSPIDSLQEQYMDQAKGLLMCSRIPQDKTCLLLMNGQITGVMIKLSDLATTSHTNMKNYSLIRSINLKMLVRFPKKIFTHKKNISQYCIWIYTDTGLFFPPQAVAFTYTTHTDWEKARGRCCYRKGCVSLILTRRFVKLTLMLFVDLE